MQRNEARAARLGRRPLRLLSNAHNNRGNINDLRNDGGKRSSKPRSGKKLFSSSSVKKIEGKGRAEEAGDDDILDRLLLVQSDLSNLTRQVTVEYKYGKRFLLKALKFGSDNEMMLG